MENFKPTKKELAILDKCFFISDDFLGVKDLYNKTITVGEHDTITYYYKNDEIIGWSDDASFAFFLHESLIDHVLTERLESEI